MQTFANTEKTANTICTGKQFVFQVLHDTCGGLGEVGSTCDLTCKAGYAFPGTGEQEKTINCSTPTLDETSGQWSSVEGCAGHLLLSLRLGLESTFL